MSLPTAPPTTGPAPPLVQPALPPIIPIVPRSAPMQIDPTRRQYNDASRPVSARQATVAGLNELLPILYGTDQLGAKITAIVTQGTNLLLRCEWCSEINDGVSAYFVDGAAPVAGMSATHYNGSQVTPDGALVSAFAALGETYTDTLAGVAYSVITVAAGTTQGFPRVVATMRGIKVRTTAGGAYAYNDNPVWLVAWLLTEQLGLAIDWTAFATAAAVCDAMVGTPAEKKYTIGLSMETQQDVWKWIDFVLGYMRGHRWYDNGVWGITLETAAQASVGNIDHTLMRGGDIEINSRSLRNQPTVVRVHYTNTQGTMYEDAYAEAMLPGVGTTVDYLLEEIRKSGINRHSQANREAIEMLNDFYLCDTSGSFVTRDQGLKYLEGDLVQITHPRGPSAKKVHILRNDPVEAGRWRVSWREFDPARYSSVVVTTPTYADTNLPLPTAPPKVMNVALTEQVVTTPSGAFPASKINATWDSLASYPFIDGYRVVVTDAYGAVVDDDVVGSNAYSSPPQSALATYTVRVYARSTVGAISAEVSPYTITLTANGTNSMAEFFAYLVSGAGWTLSLVEQFTTYPGDPVFRIRTVASREPVETSIYLGSNQLTPGRATSLLDTFNSKVAGAAYPSAKSPIIDIGSSETVFFALLNVASWINTYQDTMRCLIRCNNSPTLVGAVAVESFGATVTGRYAQLEIRSKVEAS